MCCDIGSIWVFLAGESDLNTNSFELLLHQQGNAVKRARGVVAYIETQLLAVFLINAVGVQSIAIVLQQRFCFCCIRSGLRNLAVSGGGAKGSNSRAHGSTQILGDFIAVHRQIHSGTDSVIQSLFIENVELKTGSRYFGELIAVGIQTINLLGSSSNTGIAVNFTILHGHQLRLVLLHIVEDGAVQLHLAVPVRFVAGNLNGSFGFKGLDNKGTSRNGRIIKILRTVQVEDGKLGAGKIVEHRWVYVRGGNRQCLFVHSLHGEIRQIGKAGIHFRNALQIPNDHIRCQSGAIGEPDTVLQGNGPCKAIVAGFCALCQKRYNRAVVSHAEECLGDAIVGRIPAVVLLVRIQTGVSEVHCQLEDFGLRCLNFSRLRLLRLYRLRSRLLCLLLRSTADKSCRHNGR